MRNLLAATAISAVMALTGTAIAQDSEPMTVDSIIATVDGTEITMGHVLVLHDQLPDEYKNLPADVLFNGIVSQLVEQTLLAQAVDEDKVSVTAQIAIENERRAQFAGAYIDEVLKREISEEQVQELYDVSVANMVPTPEFNASHILVETEEEALALIETLNGGADFAELAMEKSTGPSGPQGGDLGWFGKGMMVPEFEAAVLELEVGGVSTPVQTQFGWHVVKLDDARDTPVPTIDELRNQLMGQLRDQSISVEIETLRLAADVTQVDGIDPEVLSQITFPAE